MSASFTPRMSLALTLSAFALGFAAAGCTAPTQEEVTPGELDVTVQALEAEHAADDAPEELASNDGDADDEAEDTSPDDLSDPENEEVDALEDAPEVPPPPSATDIAESDANATLWADETGAIAAHRPGSVSSADGASRAAVSAAAGRCANPSPLTFYPVRAKHDTGYQRSPSSGASGNWTCGSTRSNSDFIYKSNCSDPNAHFGIDVWAKRGAPVVASVSGKVVESRYDSYSGNIVTIQDSCGWWHFNIHLKDRKVTKGKQVKAGQLIGHVGDTGTASGGTVHLHYSVYPGSGAFCRGKNPHAALKKVEKDVCWVPVECNGQICKKGEKCTYWGSQLSCTPS